MDWLAIAPEWRDIVGFTLLSALVAIGAHALYRRFVPAERLKGHHDVAGFLVAIVGVLYGVVLGFVVVTAWSNFDETQRTSDLEAGDIGDALIIAQTLPEPAQSRLVEKISEYAREIRYRAFPELVQGTQDARTTNLLDNLLSLASSSGSDAPSEPPKISLARQNVVASLRSAADRERLLSSPSRLPSGMYLALIVGGIMVLSFVFLFGVENSAVHLMMTGVLAGMIGLLMALVVDLDHPYSGAFHVSSEAWALLVDRYHMDEEAVIPVRTSGNSLEAIRKRGKLIVGVRYDTPLIGYLDPEGGVEPAGFDVDIARAIANEVMGDPSRIQFVQVVPDDFVKEVTTGNVDFIIAAATITPERLRRIDFSNVYFRTGQALLVRSDSTIRSYRDLADRSIAAVKGSTSEATIHRIAPQASVGTFGTNIECVQALQDGEVDATTSDEAILAGFQSRNPASVKVAGSPFTFEPYGIGMKKRNASLEKAVNDALGTIGSSGRYDQIYSKWFGHAPPSDWRTWYGMPSAKAAQAYAEQRQDLLQSSR